MIEPDIAIRVTGRGCRPNADVGVILGASHASGRELVTFHADGRGNFSRKVSIPFAGERTAAVFAECDDAAGNRITAFEAAVTYRRLPAERTRRSP